MKTELTSMTFTCYFTTVVSCVQYENCDVISFSVSTFGHNNRPASAVYGLQGKTVNNTYAQCMYSHEYTFLVLLFMD
jgi:hypothetical protein